VKLGNQDERMALWAWAIICVLGADHDARVFPTRCVCRPVQL